MTITTISSKAMVLLRRLAEDGCFAMHDRISDGHVGLFVLRNRMTLGAGRAPVAFAEELLAAGFALWSTAPTPHLLITADGRGALATAGKAALPRMPDTGRAQMETVMVDAGHATSRPLQVNMAENPLLWLHRRKGRDGQSLISDAAFAAGERFRADLTLAGTMPRVTSNWAAAIAQGPRGSGAQLNASEAMMAAQQRVKLAALAVGPEFSGLLIDVCGFLKGMELVERERGWPPRSAKLLLVMGLGRLARHYGLDEGQVGKPRSRTTTRQAKEMRPESASP